MKSKGKKVGSMIQQGNSGLNGLGVTQAVAEDVGQRLRDARESGRITTSNISTRIKVREHYLIAIEQGRWDELPPGLNGRGLVRIYAKELAVHVVELEPKNNNQTGTPEPVQAFQVVNRNSPAGRALSKASIELVRSIPRSPTTLAPNISHNRKTPKFEVRNTVAPAMISDRDDEEPLDIITPDVANILGLNLSGNGDDFSDANWQLKKSEAQARPTIVPDIPSVTAEQVANEMFVGQQTPIKNETNPMAQVTPPLPIIPVAQVTPPLPIIPVAQVTPPLPIIPMVQPDENLVSSVHAMASSLSKNADGRAEKVELEEAPVYVNNFEAPSNSSEILGQQKNRTFAYAVAAALILMLGGGFIYQKMNQTGDVSEAIGVQTETPEAQQSGAVTVDGEKIIQEDPVVVQGEPIPKIEAVKPELVNASSSSVASEVPVALATADSAAHTVAPQAEAAKAPATVVEPQAPAAPVVALSEIHKATLTITNDVGIQVISDGKKVISGVRPAGELPIEFRKSAEILVEDGSRVKLSYGGWEHGVLGHAGRKRRLVLNADAFQTPQ